MAAYVTGDGDMLDEICRRYYGARAGTVEAVLQANPGLAARGPVLPAGVRIELPDLGDAPPPSGAVRLWE